MNPGNSPEAAVTKEGFLEEALVHLDRVYGFALRLTAGNTDEADDLVQETFLRSYRSWGSYTRGTNARAWLFRICRNAFLRQQEMRQRRPENGAMELDGDTEARTRASPFDQVQAFDPERRFFDSFLDEEVKAAVDRLPPEFREAVVLSDLEDLSYAEIAEVLDVPLGTVKSRIYRGRQLLQEALVSYALEMGYIRRPKGTA